MNATEPFNGTSFLSRLDRHWIRSRSAAPVLTNEWLIAVSPEHWIKYIFPASLYVLFGSAGVALLGFAVSTAASLPPLSLVFFVAALILLTAVHHWFFWFLLSESQAHIIVTNKRVVYVHETLLRHEERIEVSFEQMKTVEIYKTNMLQSLLNYGTLQFEPMVKIRRVPHPVMLTAKIEQALGRI